MIKDSSGAANVLPPPPHLQAAGVPPALLLPALEAAPARARQRAVEGRLAQLAVDNVVGLAHPKGEVCAGGHRRRVLPHNLAEVAGALAAGVHAGQDVHLMGWGGGDAG